MTCLNISSFVPPLQVITKSSKYSLFDPAKEMVRRSGDGNGGRRVRVCGQARRCAVCHETPEPYRTASAAYMPSRSPPSPHAPPLPHRTAPFLLIVQPQTSRPPPTTSYRPPLPTPYRPPSPGVHHDGAQRKGRGQEFRRSARELLWEEWSLVAHTGVNTGMCEFVCG